jgi:dTMP kinase
VKRGKLIVFEGISGTGKETQAKLLAAALKKKGIKARIVYHPTPQLKFLLSLWRKERKIDAMTEVYLLLADRYDRVRQVIIPALDAGEWVISLRNVVSALVYQGKTEGDRHFIAHEFSHFEPAPDFLFWFDMTPQEAIARIEKRHQKTGEPLGKFETPALLVKKRNDYRQVLRNVDHIRISAASSIEDIHSHIAKALGI